MHELPDHLLIAVDDEGDGPASDDERAAVACWCGCPYSRREAP
jgi:hypothetical protein